MDFLKAEIERKRKQREEIEKKLKGEATTQSNNDAKIKVPETTTNQDSTSPSTTPQFGPQSPGSDHDSHESSKKRKYVTKGEIEKLREQEYHQRMLEVGSCIVFV